MDELFNNLIPVGEHSIETLAECNAVTGQFGLSLTEQQLRVLQTRQREAIMASGRVEFGGGALKALVEAFCESPYISQYNYEETMSELLDMFYYFKTESEDRLSDDELIQFMRRHFDTTCQGSLEYLASTTLEDLCRYTRGGYESNEPDDPDEIPDDEPDGAY